MKLLIDIGNTRLKWACLDEGGLSGFGNYEHGGNVHIPAMCPVEEAWIASVAATEFNRQFEQALKQRHGVKVGWLDTASECGGVSNGYTMPEQLGVDRWAALIGARQLYRTALCVVDCGSAMTVDVMDSNGYHLGGYIVPGLRMQQELLQQGTAGIRPDGGLQASGHWGQDTRSCLQQGALQSLAALIERSSAQLANELGQSVTTVITGGDATVILPLLDLDACHEEHLVLQGMARMVEQQGD